MMGLFMGEIGCQVVIIGQVVISCKAIPMEECSEKSVCKKRVFLFPLSSSISMAFGGLQAFSLRLFFVNCFHRALPYAIAFRLSAWFACAVRCRILVASGFIPRIGNTRQKKVRPQKLQKATALHAPQIATLQK